MSKKEVEWLKEKKGVGAILSLTEIPVNDAWTDGIEYLDVPIRNHTVPTFEHLVRSVDFIMTQSSNGRKVLVHCAAGLGRTGTVLSAYLCRKYSLSPSDAIARVRSKRSGSIEKKQESSVALFDEESKRRIEKVI